MVIMSVYDATILIVSARVSPFVTEEEPESENPSTLPPRLIIAETKLSLVLVDGSKKSVPRIFPLQDSENISGCAIISFAV